MATRRSKKTVTYQVDVIGNSGAFYDVPGRVVYFYDFEKDMWVRKTAKYRNTKKIAMKKGYCFGGNYGVMEMPRYKKISVRECEEKEYRARQGFFNNLLEEITDEARNLIKVLNCNGDLLISAGNFKSRYNKKNNQAEYEMFRGLCFTPELYLTDYPDKTFSWSSK